VAAAAARAMAGPGRRVFERHERAARQHGRRKRGAACEPEEISHRLHS
jgi:hypothetical protein